MVITILLDIIHIAVNYERAADVQIDSSRDQFRFSVGMAILSLLLKPVSCLFVYQMYKERGGDCNLNIGKISNQMSLSLCSREQGTDGSWWLLEALKELFEYHKV